MFCCYQRGLLATQIPIIFAKLVGTKSYKLEYYVANKRNGCEILLNKKVGGKTILDEQFVVFKIGQEEFALQISLGVVV